jgi:protein phosphatase 2C family protein 2/3
MQPKKRIYSASSKSKMMSPSTKGVEPEWPRCSFFGIYDGHGGASCADFLRDNLHKMIIQQECFPRDPREALKRGFAKAERKWTEVALNTQAYQNMEGKPNSDSDKENAANPSMIKDRSGSCAIVSLIVGEMCYVANVGDSRAVLSG